MVNRRRWLSLTPEPEIELPGAVATLRGGRPDRAAEEAERARIERLILRGSEARWLAYLHEVVELIGSPDPQLAQARATAIAVVSNHHHLLLAISPRGASRTARERERLATTEPGVRT
jgi:hypothetical protein